MDLEDRANVSGAASAKHRLVQRVRMDRAGRVLVPASFRKALDMHTGQELTLSLQEGAIRLQTIDAALEKIWSIAKRRRTSQGGVVDDFIAERRAEAVKPAAPPHATPRSG